MVVEFKVPGDGERRTHLLEGVVRMALVRGAAGSVWELRRRNSPVITRLGEAQVVGVFGDEHAEVR